MRPVRGSGSVGRAFDWDMRGSRQFCQSGSKFDNVIFLVDEGIEGPNITLNGQSSARQRNVI